MRTPLKIVKLEINGSTQQLRICAERTGLPPILIVQAGPGFALLHEVAKFQRRLGLERDFLVSYWDQRGCGIASRQDANSVSMPQQVDDLRTRAGVDSQIRGTRRIELHGHEVRRYGGPRRPAREGDGHRPEALLATRVEPERRGAA